MLAVTIKYYINCVLQHYREVKEQNHEKFVIPASHLAVPLAPDYLEQKHEETLSSLL